MRDSYGNESPVYSDSTLLDTTLPLGQLYINGNAALTSLPAVKLFITWPSMVTRLQRMAQSSRPSSIPCAAASSGARPVKYSLGL